MAFLRLSLFPLRARNGREEEKRREEKRREEKRREEKRREEKKREKERREGKGREGKRRGEEEKRRREEEKKRRREEEKKRRRFLVTLFGCVDTIFSYAQSEPHLLIGGRSGMHFFKTLYPFASCQFQDAEPSILAQASR